MPRVSGKQPRVGDVLEMERKHARAFVASGFAKEYVPPAPGIPASPSEPLSVVEESVVEEVMTAEEYVGPKDRPEKPRRYKRRDMQAE